ncbi:metallophosphoesterase [Effusibacillus dendaii]|uniref:Ser/threonine protein phosphatase n=1 Tax=Effusibacillus dendaii TaxID=2743772 RepID=A0A7I8D5B6_9BACL|nr:metallophosphoesterase [Effusibacillus dendaii]BCJ85343.1 ser/threonine protein phosphatase [Effusibacillus dendaii]
MRIFAIGDPHLSFAVQKPMDIFGEQWADHPVKIESNWIRVISRDDWILIPGDISWALHLEEAKPDLQFLANLPGKKILIRGNHDYWWSTVSKVRRLLPDSMYALQNDSIQIGDIAVCGTRGWNCPGSYDFSEHDQQIYEREVGRLKLSLDQADKRAKERWVMLHYPPTNEKHEPSGFIEVMQKYDVSVCVYGHLHGEGHRNALQGEHFGIRFYLTACDYLNFQPVRLL